MTKQLDLQNDEPHRYCTTSAKHLIIAAALLTLLFAPCNLGTRTTTFTINGKQFPAKCLYSGNRTLGCTIENK